MSANRYILGIDPGLDGALAFCAPQSVAIFDMPTTSMKENGRLKRKVCLESLAKLLDMYAPSTEAACVEAPNAMPEQGLTSTFNFGFSCGAAQGAVAAHRIPILAVRPSVWKGALGLTSDKNKSRTLAAELFPQAAHYFTRAKDDGRAEALLLAYYLVKFATR